MVLINLDWHGNKIISHYFGSYIFGLVFVEVGGFCWAFGLEIVNPIWQHWSQTLRLQVCVCVSIAWVLVMFSLVREMQDWFVQTSNVTLAWKNSDF